MKIHTPLACAAVVCLGFALSAGAADRVKANNSTALNSASSWVGGVLPAAGDVIIFDSTVSAANTASLDPGGINLSQIRVANNANGPINITLNPAAAGRLISLNYAAAIPNGIDLSAAAQDLTINCNVRTATGVTGTHTNIFNVASGRTLTLGAIATDRILQIQGGNTRVIEITNAGSVVINSSVTNVSATRGRLELRGPGVLRLAGTNNFGYLAGDANWGMIVEGGTLQLASPNAVFSSTTIASFKYRGGQLEAVGGPRTNNMSVRLENVVGQAKAIIGAQPLVFSGAVVNAGNQTLTISNTALTSFLGPVDLAESTAVRTLTLNGPGNVEFLGSLRDSQAVSGAAGNLRVAGSGVVTLKAANSFSGDTFVDSGTLALGVGGSLGSSSNLIVAAGATLDVSAVAFTLGSLQTLRGAGSVTGSATVNGTVAPGTNSIGTLSFSSPPTLSGKLLLDINRNAGSPLADKLAGLGTLGGVLVVTNIGATLQAGDTFDLLDGTLSGSFASLNLPGGTAHWNTSDLSLGGSITFIGNNPPSAANFDLGVAVGGSTTVAVVGKYCSDADAGDTLTIVSVSSPANGTVSIGGGTNLTYTSTNAAASDSLTYTVTDGLESVTRTVSVSTFAAEGFNKLSGPTGAGPYAFSYLGIPNADYALEESPDLVPPYTWYPVLTNTASPTGALEFNGVNLSYPSGAFRTRHVP
jgi:autotransporter-associated beta strand protein